MSGCSRLTRRRFRRDPTHALFADQSQSIPDNLVALFGRIRAWNYSAETAQSAATFAADDLKCEFISSLIKDRLEQQGPSRALRAMLAAKGRNWVQTSRRSFMASMAATATAAALLPVAGIARDAGGVSEELAYRTAADLVKGIAGRQVSSRELVDNAISRIEALDPKINAVVVRDFERARAAADAADAALAKGENRALLGVPMTVKEQNAVAGLPTTRGDPKYKDWKAEVDALVVQRLKAAGAIILGKTNVPLNLSDWQSFNEVYGTTNNPWNLSRTPGGSSGGSAAALAAGFVPLELGSDIGGSLRAPAHFCGVFSHKPTLDLVPQRSSGPPQISAVPVRGDLAVYGPMARSAADLALELEVLAGPDELMEGVGYKLALPPPRHDKLADFRVLVIDTHPLCPTASSIKAALNGLIAIAWRI